MKTTQQKEAWIFLQGGGEMGEMTRNFKWEDTSLGSPDNWPYSLRITVSNLLRSRFPMFLWWGDDMIQFYNDAYRPSMGVNGKHPQALGQKGEECWPEIWEIISPLHKNVKTSGEATWSENQLVPIYRNGKTEDVYWTFSYSSVLNDNGQHGGILVTCMETTDEVLRQKKLEESESRLHFALTAGHLGSWELHLKNMDLRASRICKQIFGQPVDQPFSYATLLSAVHPHDRARQQEAVLHTINTGADYDIDYRIIYPDKSVHWVNIRAQLHYDNQQRPDCMVGVSLDITERKNTESQLQESEERIRNIIEQAPVAIGVTRSDEFIFESINPLMLQIIQKKDNKDVLDRSLKEVLPELITQPIYGIMGHVLQTGETYMGKEVEVEMVLDSFLQRRYFDITYSRLTGRDGVDSLLHVASDVTEQVLSRRKLEENEAKLRSILNSAPTAIGVFAGPDLILENPNQLMIEVMSAGPDIEGKSFRELLSGLVEGDQQFLALIDSVRKTGKAFEAAEVEVYFKPEKRTRFFNLNFIPLLDESGEVYAVLDVSVDVTGQVSTRRQLLAIESRFRNTVMQAPVAIAIFRGPEQIVEVANQEHLRLWGRTAEQVVGLPLSKVLPDGAQQKFGEIVASVLRTGNPYYAKELHADIWRDTKFERAYFNFVFEALREDEGSISGVIAVANEVTEAVVAGQSLAASEAKFRLLIEEAPFATALYTGPDLIIDTINDAMLQLWNKAPTVAGKTFEQALPELEGQPFARLLKEVYRTGIEYVGKAMPADIAVNGKLQRGWYNFNYKAVRNQHGEVYGIVHMAVDVSEQVLTQKKIEENEAALATALEQARLSKEAAELGTFDMDVQTGKMHWDDRCRILFGITHTRPVSFDQDFIERLHHDDRQRILNSVHRAFVKSESNGDYDVEYRTIGAEDGVERWVKAKGKVYFDNEDKPVRFIGSVLNITVQMTALQKIERTVEERTKELAAANEALQDTNKELQRSNQNLEEFAYAASHDLKEPIRKIHFFTNHLKEQLSEHLQYVQGKAFDRIESATERMGNLIDDLLLYSHVSQRPHETETIDLIEKVQRVLEDLELDIEEKGAVIHLGNLPVIKGYRRQIQQLFQNLISNSLKYSKSGVAPQIDITSTEVIQNGRNYYLIAVKDNGIGFEQEYADKIFQIFARLHGKGEYSGTGVGLSIVKKVVDNHNGFIRVESIPEQGSTFMIGLPV